MYIIYGQKYNKYPPILDSNTKEVLDDGNPKKITLGRWQDEKLAKAFAENIKANTGKRMWKIWVEKS